MRAIRLTTTIATAIPIMAALVRPPFWEVDREGLETGLVLDESCDYKDSSKKVLEGRLVWLTVEGRTGLKNNKHIRSSVAAASSKGYSPDHRCFKHCNNRQLRWRESRRDSARSNHNHCITGRFPRSLINRAGHRFRIRSPFRVEY
jgi:hypothetical protein